MTTEFLQWVTGRGDLPPGPRLLLIVLHMESNPDGTVIRSHANLASKIGATSRSVQTYLDQLRERGYLNWDNREQKGQRANRYRLTPWVENSSTLEPATPEKFSDLLEANSSRTCSSHRGTTYPYSKNGISSRNPTPCPDLDGSAVDDDLEVNIDYSELDPDINVWGPKEKPKPAKRKRKTEGEDRKAPGANTGMGLVDFWNDVVGKVEWGSGLSPTNKIKLAAAFRDWLKNDRIDADTIRAMIRRYATDSGMRNQNTVPWKDFLNKRELLLGTVKKSKQESAMEEDRYDANAWI